MVKREYIGQLIWIELNGNTELVCLGVYSGVVKEATREQYSYLKKQYPWKFDKKKPSGGDKK